MWVRPNTSLRRPQNAGFRPIHLLGTDTGCFQVGFTGPGDNIERLRVPDSRLLVTPSIEARLNERQKKMMLLLVQGEELTSRRCETEFRVTRDTAARDFGLLIELGLAKKRGQGRSTRYVWGGET